MSEGESATITALVTDPEGADDLVGGTLYDESGGSYGAFMLDGSAGTFVLEVTWDQVDQNGTIEFELEVNRKLVGVFFDQAGHRAGGSATLRLHCSGLPACSGTCTDLATDPEHCGECGHVCGATAACVDGECAEPGDSPADVGVEDGGDAHTDDIAAADVPADRPTDLVNDRSATDTSIDSAPDGPTDTSADQETADVADGGGDTCIPTSEICNGLDDDCDGEPDDDINCGTCPDPNNSPDSPIEATQGMVLIVRPGLDPFCIDLFEASRTDATIGSEGTSTDGVANSVRAVLPWSDVTLGEAGTACTAAGKRLCTLEEWTEGCGGAEGLRFPYGDSYNGAFCNGSDAGTGQAGATGSRFNCRGPDATFDMSGNLEEWVADGSAEHPTRGGAFNDVEPALRCSGSDDSAPNTPPGEAVGFRCCADVTRE